MPPSNNIFTVSQLNRHVKRLLESEMGTVWLTGELSNFSIPASGHWYFSLKDDKAQIKCAMFKGNNRSVRISPKNGEQVLIRARISLYEPRGDFQVIAELMEPAGEGLLKQQFEALKRELQIRGWFDAQNKQSLPVNPSRIGIITSSSGAALHDILTVLRRRSPSSEVVIYPSMVQGEAAALTIARAIEVANARNEVDVLVVGRGGGSLEDLWSFNEEIVASAIFHSRIPTISAVGHEVDTTISDFVADVRAATPSAAAELLSKDANTQFQQLDILNQQLRRAMQIALGGNAQRFSMSWQKLQLLHPKRQIERQAQQVDELSLRLSHAIERQLERKSNQCANHLSRLNGQTPIHKISESKQRISQLQDRLAIAQRQHVETHKNQLAKLASELDIVSPLATLARGYSISTDETGTVIKSATQLKANQKFTTRFKDGVIHAVVKAKK